MEGQTEEDDKYRDCLAKCKRAGGVTEVRILEKTLDEEKATRSLPISPSAVRVL